MEPQPHWRTISQIVTAACDVLSREVWDYVAGGADSETTQRANKAAFADYMLMPRILRDVRHIDLSTSLFGQPLSLPVFPTAIGSLNLMCPDGALASAKAALGRGTTSCVGILSTPGFEEIGKACSAPLMFQLYVRGDDEWLADIVKRAEQAGYFAIALTVDSAVYGRRERDLVNGFSSRKAVDRPALAGTVEATRAEYQAGLDWSIIERLRAITSLPLILKGVMCAEDARLAMEAGIEGIYVSNHGGRQLDHAPASLHQLAEIADVVGDRAEILFDGGVMRGTDIIKALALGARAVGLGRLQAYALAAGGESGMAAALDILAEEMTTALALMGKTQLSELDRSVVRGPSPLPVTV